MPTPKDEATGIRILIPIRGTCPLCAARHEKGEPHDRDSLYFQLQFYRRHKRLPTWEDAKGTRTKKGAQDAGCLKEEGGGEKETQKRKEAARDGRD